MQQTKRQKVLMEKLVLGAVLTALVILLQYLGQFIRFGAFAISLVLIPIIIGAATCGTKISTWLGFVFSIVVLMTDAAAFLAISVPGTIFTVILKGTLCGFAAGCVYEAFKKTNNYVACVLSAIICPIVNTGIFLLGCRLFFFDAISTWGIDAGFESTTHYMFFGLAGVNFLVELATNIILSPAIVAVLNIVKRTEK
jgi:uncharacterized membrane protein